jgi:hypothetical protein
MLIISHEGSAQADLEYKRMLAQYPGERAVIITAKEQVFIQMEKGKPVVKQESYVEMMYLDNMAAMFSEHSIDYSELDLISTISASTLVPNKTKYREVKVKEFIRSDKMSRSVFYDGGRSVSFLYPSLSVGCKTKLKYVRVMTEPRLLSAYNFQSNHPIKESQFSVTVSNDIEIDWKIFNMKDSSVSFSKTSAKGNQTVYTWKCSNIPGYKGEEDSPGPRYFVPHLAIWIKSYTADGKKKNLLGTPEDLYNWYYELVTSVSNEASPEVKDIVDSLLSGETNEMEKVRKVFYWVQDNVKYIAFEDGMGGFIPRSAQTVCHRRYGDCKDMANLIHNMLGYANVTSHLTWIGSRRIPYGYSQVATPIVDDHMICTYIKDGEYYFLDATGQFIPLGTPTGFIQDKEALISVNKEKFIIQKVPVPDHKRNSVRDSVSISIVDGKIMGKGYSELSGYEKIDMAYDLMIGESQKQTILREFYNKGNNKFLIDSFQLHHLKDRDKNLNIEYTFNIADYVKTFNNEIYINMHLNKDLQKENINAERILPIDKKHHKYKRYVVVLTIPEGYKVSYLPPAKEYKDERFGFAIEYKISGKKVILTETNYSKVLILQKEDFEQWNSMIKELKKAYNEVLILKKI